MDLIIKNLEKLQDYHTKEGKHPIERLVLDFDKLSEMKDFTKIFEKSCEKYIEVGESYLVPNEDIKKAMEPKISDKPCSICSNFEKKLYLSSCNVCQSDTNHSFWKLDAEKAKLQSSSVIKDADHFKEITERMKGEFDATGKDVKIFMNERVIKE